MLVCIFFQTNAQNSISWVDSVMKSLSPDEKIAQLIMVRLSSIDLKTRTISYYDSTVERDIRKYNIGGICLFQGPAVKQAALVNAFQSIAKTPILIAIDGETGVGMRVDSVTPLPKMMMLGALRDSALVYRYGKWVAEQCKQMGIQVNFAPVVDVNNNPDNPVINDRSFGENKYKVAQLATQYMLGMKDAGIMGSAKHFPGHGDVAVDSHLDLPVINKNRAELDSLELYPFKKLIDAGVGSVMVGHLFIPAIDNTPKRASSISEKNVTGLLRNELGFHGLTFTDALEMKGVAAEFPDGAAGVESLIAGNDMLCLPGEVGTVIQKVKDAIASNRLSWEKIDGHVKKVLEAKFAHGLSDWKPVSLLNLTQRLNEHSDAIKKEVAEKAITLGRLGDPGSFPLNMETTELKGAKKNIALIDYAKNRNTQFAGLMRKNYNADVFLVDNSTSAAFADSLLQVIQTNYDHVVMAIHELPRYPANNFNMNKIIVNLFNRIAVLKSTNLFIFGNPYAAKSFCTLNNILLCYDDDPITHVAAAAMLKGEISPEGILPVSVCENLPAGTSIKISGNILKTNEAQSGIGSIKTSKIDSVINDAIARKAAPGMALLVIKNNRIIMEKTYGNMSYTGSRKVTQETVFDMASVTKICATTLSVMKLYDEGKIDLNKTLGDYIPWTKNTNKESLRIRDILLHEAGLKAWIPFYKEIADSSTMKALPGYFSKWQDNDFSIKVDDSLFMLTAWRDTMISRILTSPLEKKKTYIYSDNDFIFLGELVKSISGLSLEQYVWKNFYSPLGLRSTGFNPTSFMSKQSIAPTEQDPYFRERLVQGYVHDPGAAMFGGVSGHAGLFSNAYETAVLMSVVMNGGKLNGKRFFSDSTVTLFTSYQSEISRRGLGFDKPEKDNNNRKSPYPALAVSQSTFGHTGFTGTCTWADPEKGIVFVLLANRVHPTASNTFGDLNVRGKVMEEVFTAY
jgi:beta-glucosidase-like glycosyl hydrolase/CubicO group peptidase (beta-lactamase class C family)